MQAYIVGQRIPELAGHPEVPRFDIDDNGALLRVFFRAPTPKEVEAFRGGRFELKCRRFGDVLEVCFRPGDINWMDAPYTPHLSKGWTHLDELAPGLGLALTVVLIDADTGEVMAVRLLGLSERFTRDLLTAADEVASLPFDHSVYLSHVADLQQRYSSKDIVKMCKSRCVFDQK